LIGVLQQLVIDAVVKALQAGGSCCCIQSAKPI